MVTHGFAADIVAQSGVNLETNPVVSETMTKFSDEGSSDSAKADRPIFDVRLFGAGGNGITLDTEAIQKAIDAAASAGGGFVRLAPGKYLCGSLILKSHVTMWLDKGAVLLGSPHRADYSKLDFYGLLLAEGQEDIGIAGEGVIDGQGALLVADTRKMMPQRNPPYADESQRPFIINFRNCRNVVVRDITFKESSCWVQDYHNCKNLTVENVKVRTCAAITNDGLDIDGCSDVVVRGCDIDSEDDGICLKSSDSLCENILVENCRVRSSSNAFKLGTASVKGFKNITCRNLEIYDTYCSGIALESVDGSELENVNISHINITNTGNAVFVRLGHRNTGRLVGTLQNVTISDVSAQIISRARQELNKFPTDWLNKRNNGMFYLYPVIITGIPNYPIRDLTLKNISIAVDGAGDGSKIKKSLPREMSTVPECEDRFPSCTMFGELPAWDIYCRHVNGIKFDNVTSQVKGEDFRPALVCEDVKRITLERFRISSAGNEPVIVLKDVDGAIIRDSPAQQKGVHFLETLGACRNIQSQ